MARTQEPVAVLGIGGMGHGMAGIREFEAAGYTHVALIQVGADTQEQIITWAATELLPTLRAA